MKVLVTGASGFLGRSVVRAAAAAGHKVVALVRPTANVEKLNWPASVQIVRGDLRQIGDWTKQLGGVEAVLHLAAVPSGDFATQFAGTVVATERLLDHLPMGSIRRFVHVSSFTVYDYATVGFHGTLTEATPLEREPEMRGPYTITKIVQERLVIDTCKIAGTPLVVIRPGAIVGPGANWDFGRVLKLGPFDLVYSPWAKFPLTFVTNCADAIIRALDATVPSGSIYNIVDDDLPSYSQFHRLGRRFGSKDVGLALYLPWLGVSLIGAGVELANRLAFDGRARLPEMLDYRRQRVRWKPMSYSNQRAKQELGWSPAVSLKDANFNTTVECTR